MKVQFTPRALLEIGEIGEYISNDNPEAAQRVVREIKRVAISLSTFPLRGRKQRGRNIRKIAAGLYRYNIYYRVEDANSIVLFLNVRHMARRRGRKYQDT